MAVAVPETRSVYRTCTVCEANCGLRFDVDQGHIVAVAPDEDDVFSRGFACRKGIAFAGVVDDPDRLRKPLIKGTAGDFHETSWDDALGRVVEGLTRTRRQHGGDAVGLYVGNPIVHQHGMLLLRNAFAKALGTRNCYSAGSQDTSPRFAVSRMMYGNSLAVPVPDLDRTQLFVCVGANPAISNGSLLTAPDMRRRIREIRARQGKVVVIDPRYTETAQIADQHIAVKPGGDAALLLAVAATIVADGRAPQAWLTAHTRGWPEIEARLRRLHQNRARASRHAGVPLETITRLARDLVAAPSSAIYTRTGVGNSRFGTLATYAADLVNILTGRLGVAGGAMFAAPALDPTLVTRLPGQDGLARWHSRVRKLPETFGDLPAACLSEEMEVPGPGQIKALLTIAGNPILSTPNGKRLEAAIAGLDFVASVDFYVNETTRHADVILPPAPPLSDEHIDLLYPVVYARTIARWSPAVVAPGRDGYQDWQIMLSLIHALGGGPTGIRPVDGLLAIARWFGYRWHPRHLIDALLRLGPHGDHFWPWSRGLNLRKLEGHPHGLDLGPLPEGFERRLFFFDRRVRLAPPPLLAAWDDLEQALAVEPDPEQVTLIGRRQILNKNSWLHNLPALHYSDERCRLFVHPNDARRFGVVTGGHIVLDSGVNHAEIAVQVTDEVREGVVSLPHGWGHGSLAPWQRVAAARPGVSINDWTNDQDVEGCIGQSILNGVPVRLRRV